MNRICENCFTRLKLHQCIGVRTCEMLKYQSELCLIIYNCYFEPGKWTDADEYFKDLKHKYDCYEIPLSYLLQITVNHPNDEHILEGILHIVSNYDYEIIGNYGLIICTLCMNSQFTVVQDELLRCIDKWESTDFIPILDIMNTKHIWLQNYRNEVMDRLLSQENKLEVIDL